MNLDLIDRTRWDATEVSGLYVHIVEGISVTCGVCLGQTTGTCDACVGGANLFPSHNWVALSEQKCETCNGTGRCRDCGGAYCGQGCQHCLGSGRPLVRVTVPCPNRSWIGGNEPVCPTCGGGGRASIGTVTVEAVTAWIYGKYGVIVRRMA